MTDHPDITAQPVPGEDTPPIIAPAVAPPVPGEDTPPDTVPLAPDTLIEFTVRYTNGTSVRHTFPTETDADAWYGEQDHSQIVTIEPVN